MRKKDGRPESEVRKNAEWGKVQLSGIKVLNGHNLNNPVSLKARSTR